MSKILQPLKKKTIIDDELGTLTFVNGNNSSEKYWTFNRKIISTECEVEFCIDNGSDGITTKQKKLVFEIEKELNNLIKPIEEYLNAKLTEISSYTSKLQIDRDLNIEVIHIAKDGIDWELGLAEKNSFTFYEVNINNGIPNGLGISA